MKLTWNLAAASVTKPAAKPKPAAKEKTRRVSDKEIGFMWLLGELDKLVNLTSAPSGLMKEEFGAIARGRVLKDTHVETICRHARKRIERLHVPVLALMKKRGLVE